MNADEYPETIAFAKKVDADWTDPDFQFGLHVYCYDWHGGLNSPEYAAMCEIRARIFDNDYDGIRNGRHDRNDEWLEARKWYRALKRARTATTAA